jgi:hypothetical protein
MVRASSKRPRDAKKSASSRADSSSGGPDRVAGLAGGGSDSTSTGGLGRDAPRSSKTASLSGALSSGKARKPLGERVVDAVDRGRTTRGRLASLPVLRALRGRRGADARLGVRAARHVFGADLFEVVRGERGFRIVSLPDHRPGVRVVFGPGVRLFDELVAEPAEHLVRPRVVRIDGERLLQHARGAFAVEPFDE